VTKSEPCTCAAPGGIIAPAAAATVN